MSHGSRGRNRLAQVRFYVDADVLGLAHILAGLRIDVTYPGDPGAVIHRRKRPPCPIAASALDPQWLPKVAAQDWLVITRDRRIQQHKREIDAVREHGVKMIALAGDDAVNKWAQLEVVMCRWRDIEKKLTEPGPFIYRATRTRLSPIDIST